MRKQIHIRTRLSFTLIGLTCAILLAVMLAFNIAVQSYIRSRVGAQLNSVSQSVSEARTGPRDPRGPFDEHPDKVMGTKGSAIVLDEQGNLVMNLHGDNDVAMELALWYRDQDRDVPLSNETVSLNNGAYIVSTMQDPVEENRILLAYVDVTAITAFAKRMNRVLLLVIGAAILLSVFLSSRFARSFARPVQTLSDFASEIGGGKLEPRELSFRDAELQQLADSMNGMAQELNEAKQKQETFFQNVSHELRTPLTSIRGNAEGIVYGVIEPAKAGRVILSESDKLTGMVEDILYLSRMGRGKPEGKLEPIDLREVISLCVSEQHTEAEKKGLRFSFDFDEIPVMMEIREQDAQRLFGNLISNAVRYANMEIRLSCHNSDGKAIILISDDGPGIAEADLPHVFERFYKGKDGKHGIGLAIARSVAEAYQGTLSARNEHGAVFETVFPVRHLQ